MAERIIALTGSASEIVNVELPAERIGDPARRRPDITRAREVLGWEPAVDLEEGLLGMIEHFRTSEHLG